MSNPKINEMLSELRIEDTPSPPRHRRRRVVYVEDTDSDEDLNQKATQTGPNLIIEDTLIEDESVEGLREATSYVATNP